MFSRASLGAPAPSSNANKVNVAIRVRPLIERENNDGDKRRWIIGEQDLKPCDTDQRPLPNGQVYVYDHVFGEVTQTTDVYARVVAPLVNESLKGFNGTILCYGQTSSGKTHTLYGSNTDKGIISLFADHLFDRIKEDDGKRQYMIKVGLLEIYNEKVTDLWNSENPIDIQERDGKIVPSGLEEMTIVDRNDLRNAADRAQRQRHIGETRMNKESSRSHTILRVIIESFDLSLSSANTVEDNTADGNVSMMTSAVLHFVDLAGSEKQSQTGAEGERLREAININKSLSTLSRVIQQLSENAAAPETLKNQVTDALCTDKRKGPISRFVNFRDSKLTRLLQSTLNGEAYTSMICCVTPVSLEETKSTLNFAKLAKKIQIAPKQNLCSNNIENEKKVKELLQVIEGKDKEVLALKHLVRNMQLSSILSQPKHPSATAQFQANVMSDRRHSLCPTFLHRSSENQLPSTDFGSFNPRFSVSEETFLSTEETLRHFRQLATIKESAVGEQVDCLDKEIQTDPFLSPKKPKLVSKVDPSTPLQTLRITTSLLRESYESDRSEWIEEKQFLESETQTLKEEASKVAGLQKEIEQLKVEKLALEEDVLRQIQSSKSQLKLLQLQEVSAMTPTTNRSAETVARDIQCDLIVESEIALQETLETARSEWIKEKKAMEADILALKEEASKVVSLQKEIEQLQVEKKALEDDVLLQIQNSQSQLKRLNMQETAVRDIQCDLTAESEAALRVAHETERSEWIKEKKLMEFETQSLKTEALKVASLQEEIEQLKSEKQEIETDVLLQLQSSQSQLKRLQLQLQEECIMKQTAKQSAEMVTSDIQCDLIAENETALREAHETERSEWIKEKKLMEFETESLKTETLKVASLQEEIEQLKYVADNEIALREAHESDRSEWIKEKKVMEADTLALKEEASKVVSLQKEIEQLQVEKKALEDDVLLQIQNSQLQQLKMPETAVRNIQCDLTAENETALRAAHETERSEWIKERKVMEADTVALKEEASKVVSLQKEIEHLQVEKKVMEADTLALKEEASKVVTLQKEIEQLQVEKKVIEADTLALKEEASKVVSLQKEIEQLQGEKKVLEDDVLLQIQNSQLQQLKMPETAVRDIQCDLTAESESALRAAHETERSEWIKEKKVMEADTLALKEEASKVVSLQKEIEQLQVEKKALEDDVLLQIQNSQLKQLQIPETAVRDIQCDLTAESETALRTAHENERSEWIKEKKSMEFETQSLKKEALKVASLEEEIEQLKFVAENEAALQEALETARSEWSKEKKVMEADTLALKEEASKVVSLQKEIEHLQVEKKALEDDVLLQIQHSQLKQLQIPETAVRDIQCDLTAEIETALRAAHETERSEWIKEKKLMEFETQSLKKEALKVANLQEDIEQLKSKKQEIETDALLQLQSSQSQLKRLQLQLQEECIMKQSAEMVTRDIQCDLIAENETALREAHESDRSEWIKEKKLMESETQALQEQLTAEKELAAMQVSTSAVKVNRPIQCDLLKVEEFYKLFDKNRDLRNQTFAMSRQINSLKDQNKDAKKLAELQTKREVAIAKKDASTETDTDDEDKENLSENEGSAKLVNLQMEYDRLKLEKVELENRYNRKLKSFQVQQDCLQTQLKRQQGKLPVKPAFSSTSKVTRQVQCNILDVEEVYKLQDELEELKAQLHQMNQQLISLNNLIREKDAKLAELVPAGAENTIEVKIKSEPSDAVKQESAGDTEEEDTRPVWEQLYEFVQNQKNK